MAPLMGMPEEAIFVEPDCNTISNLGVDPGVILKAMATVDTIVPTGSTLLTVTSVYRGIRMSPRCLLSGVPGAILYNHSA